MLYLLGYVSLVVGAALGYGLSCITDQGDSWLGAVMVYVGAAIGSGLFLLVLSRMTR